MDRFVMYKITVDLEEREKDIYLIYIKRPDINRNNCHSERD